MSESAGQEFDRVPNDIKDEATGDVSDAQLQDHTDPVTENSHHPNATANASNSSQFAAAVLAQHQVRAEGAGLVVPSVVRPNGPPDVLDFSEMITLCQVNNFLLFKTSK